MRLFAVVAVAVIVLALAVTYSRLASDVDRKLEKFFEEHDLLGRGD